MHDGRLVPSLVAEADRLSPCICTCAYSLLKNKAGSAKSRVMFYHYLDKLLLFVSFPQTQLGVNCSCNLHPKVLVLFEDFKICNAPCTFSLVHVCSVYKLYSYVDPVSVAARMYHILSQAFTESMPTWWTSYN